MPRSAAKRAAPTLKEPLDAGGAAACRTPGVLVSAVSSSCILPRGPSPVLWQPRLTSGYLFAWWDRQAKERCHGAWDRRPSSWGERRQQALKGLLWDDRIQPQLLFKARWNVQELRCECEQKCPSATLARPSPRGEQRYYILSHGCQKALVLPSCEASWPYDYRHYQELPGLAEAVVLNFFSLSTPDIFPGEMQTTV